MKKVYTIITILILTNSFSQNNYTQRYAISVEIIHAKPLGNNFLNKGYQPDFGFGAEFQVNFNKLFIGLSTKSNSLLIRDRSIVGNFSSSILSGNCLFAGYRHFLKNKKFYFEERIGFGDVTITNKSPISNYNITGN